MQAISSSPRERERERDIPKKRSNGSRLMAEIPISSAINTLVDTE